MCIVFCIVELPLSYNYKHTYVTIVSTLPTGLEANEMQPSTTPCLAASELTF